MTERIDHLNPTDPHPEWEETLREYFLRHLEIALASLLEAGDIDEAEVERKRAEAALLPEDFILDNPTIPTAIAFSRDNEVLKKKKLDEKTGILKEREFFIRAEEIARSSEEVRNLLSGRSRLVARFWELMKSRKIISISWILVSCIRLLSLAATEEELA